jgi:hypothetical protein
VSSSCLDLLWRFLPRFGSRCDFGAGFITATLLEKKHFYNQAKKIFFDGHPLCLHFKTCKNTRFLQVDICPVCKNNFRRRYLHLRRRCIQPPTYENVLGEKKRHHPPAAVCPPPLATPPPSAMTTKKTTTKSTRKTTTPVVGSTAHARHRPSRRHGAVAHAAGIRRCARDAARSGRRGGEPCQGVPPLSDSHRR